MHIFSRSPAKRRVQVRTALITALVCLPMLAIGPAVTYAVRQADKAPADYYGAPVKLDTSASATAPLFDERTGCRISRFGVAPWRPNGAPRDERWADMTGRALRAAGLPEEAAAKAIVAMRTGKADETAGLGNDHGQAHTSGMYFRKGFDTTYRVGNHYTLCHDSATRFTDPSRQESTTIYRIPHGGQVYFVGEFLTCGNVTRFYPAPPAALPPAAVAPPGAIGGPGAPYPLPPAGTPHGGAPGGPPLVFIPLPPGPVGGGWVGRPPTNNVSEPPMGALFVAAIAAIIWFKRK